MIPLQKAIIKTAAYFDLFDFPLTSFEIYKYLFSPEQKYSLLTVEKTTASLPNLETKQGFYFFPGRESTILTRKQRYLLAQQKIKQNRFYFLLLAKMPFVKEIYIVNNLSYLNSPKNSDIDLAIITAPNKIWTARFFCALTMKLLNKRPTPNNQKNKICLSFFATEDFQDYDKLMYDDDIHFVYWLSQWRPITKLQNPKSSPRFDHRVEAGKIQNWMKNYLPNTYQTETNRRWITKNDSKLKKFLQFIFQGFEIFFKRIQLANLSKDLRQLSRTSPKDVILSDQVLKLHTKDNRLQIKQLNENKIKSFL